MLKKIFLCCCLLMTFLSAPLASAAPEITYDHQEFDPDTLTYRLSGHVAVKTGNRTITADRAEVSLLTNEVRAWETSASSMETLPFGEHPPSSGIVIIRPR